MLKTLILPRYIEFIYLSSCFPLFMTSSLLRRYIVGLICLAILILVYLFQKEWFYSGFYETGGASDKVSDFDPWRFFLSKYTRFLINDTMALGILWALFQEKKYMNFAFAVFLLEALVMMPFYVIGVIWYWDALRWFLSHLHRLVVNPFFMMLLIPAFYYQKNLSAR